MKIRALLVSLLIFSFFPTVANACKKGHPFSIAYLRRNNNRCEGIIDSKINNNSLPDLISFATSNLTKYPHNLKIKVPGNSHQEPKISIQSFWKKRYRLDRLKTQYLQSHHTFDLNTKKVLQHKNVKIPFQNLRSLAFIIEDSEPIYFPVILGKSSGEYEFVINSLQHTAYPVLEIRYQNKTVMSDPRKNPQSGNIRLLWNYQNAPAGRYELYLENSQGKSRTFPFEHDPNWFNN